MGQLKKNKPKSILLLISVGEVIVLVKTLFPFEKVT